MKAVAAPRAVSGSAENFYPTTLAPVDHRREIQFRIWDAAMMAVLFLEIAVVMRLVLAK